MDSGQRAYHRKTEPVSAHYRTLLANQDVARQGASGLNDAKERMMLMLDEMQLQIKDMVSRMQHIEAQLDPSTGPGNTSNQCCEHRHRDKIDKGPKNQKIVKIGKILVKNRQTSAKSRYHKNIFKNRQTSARPKNHDFEIKLGCYRDVRNTASNHANDPIEVDTSASS